MKTGIYSKPMLQYSHQEVSAKLDKFIWDFNVGDNINYNLGNLFFLYRLYGDNKIRKEKNYLNKWISIALVSVIECIFYDFIVRLSQATNHFPITIDEERKKEIKKKIDKEKVLKPENDEITGEQRTFVQNYSLTSAIKLMKDFELLGKKDNKIYETLLKLAQFRNRIHIYNWYQNFEPLESKVFTDQRREKIEKIFIQILNGMEKNYSRPWPNNK